MVGTVRLQEPLCLKRSGEPPVKHIKTSSSEGGCSGVVSSYGHGMEVCKNQVSNMDPKSNWDIIMRTPTKRAPQFIKTAICVYLRPRLPCSQKVPTDGLRCTQCLRISIYEPWPTLPVEEVDRDYMGS